MTPWHGVAVQTPSGYKLLKKTEAEALGAKLVRTRNGNPSYFILERIIESKVGAK